MYNDKLDTMSILMCIIIFALISLMGITVVMMFKVGKESAKVEEKFNEIREYYDELDYLIDSADKEVVNVEVINKKIEERLDVGNNITFAPVGSMILPVNNTTTNTEYKFIITIRDLDGVEHALKVPSSTYDSISIGDSIKVTIYRNDGIYKLEPGSKDNIIEIEYGDTIK